MDCRKLQFPIILTVIAAFSILMFQLSFQYDNKYTYPAPEAEKGIVCLDTAEYEKSSLVFLIDGWEYYADKLHTPETIVNDTPDMYTYIGRFAGFDMGNPEKSPYGKATYRLHIFTDSNERAYALELPQIYTDWRLYINGEMMATGGEENAVYSSIAPENSMVTFKASDSIEIVLAVSAEKGLYSGFTYPPAFGSPEEVSDMIYSRLLIHVAEAALAVFIGILFLCIGLGSRYKRPYGILFTMCVCFAVMVSYPLVQVFRIDGYLFSIAERFCCYGMFLAFVLLQARILKLPKKAYMCMAALGLAVIITVCIEPFFVINKAVIKYRYGSFLAFYKILLAVWLIITSIYGLRRGRTGSKPFLISGVIFSLALIMDRVNPLFEPVRFGWSAEMAGLVFILISAGVLWWDTVKTYKENMVLESEKQNLIETSRMKSEFLSGVSHELQTPIAVISGYAQLTEKLIEMKPTEMNEIYENQRQIVLESGRIERMIKQLLDISRIESGCFQLDREVIDVIAVIEGIVDTYFHVIDKNNNEIRIEKSCDLPHVDIDRERIDMVFMNLLQNACRHTKNGVITISAEQKGEFIQIKVADTGEGIEPEVLPHLFEQYLKSVNSRLKASGTGLGLYLCRKTVEAHGGRIWIESDRKIGTTVYFTLPVANNLKTELSLGIIS